MNYSNVFLVVCLSAVLFAESGLCAKFPKTFKRCQVSKDLDGKPNACLTEAVEDAIKQLSSSNSKELGAASLDPLKTESIYLERGDKSPVAVKLNFTKNDLYGLSSTKIKSVSGKLSSPKDFEMIMDLTLNSVILVGPYTINGKVLILPIQGNGHSNITFNDVACKITLSGEQQIKNDKEYLKLNKFRIIIHPGSMTIFFGNLFNGDKLLGDNMNTFMNENWKDIYSELQPPLEDAFSAILFEYSRRILEKYPFERIFITE